MNGPFFVKARRKQIQMRDSVMYGTRFLVGLCWGVLLSIPMWLGLIVLIMVIIR